MFVKPVEGSKKTSQGLLAENQESKKWFLNLIYSEHNNPKVFRILCFKAEMFDLLKNNSNDIVMYQIWIQISF